MGVGGTSFGALKITLKLLKINCTECDNPIRKVAENLSNYYQNENISLANAI